MAIRSTSSKLLTSTHRALRRRQLLLRHAWRATSLEARAQHLRQARRPHARGPAAS